MICWSGFLRSFALANNQADGPDAGAVKLLEDKLALINQVFETTQQELLLVDMEGLTPLLERKDRLIEKISAIDEQLGAVDRQGLVDAPQVREITELVEAILDNQRALEARMNEEYSQLREELRDLDRESRLKQYLERQKRVESKIDLKK